MGLAVALVLFGAVGCGQRSEVAHGGDVSQSATQGNFHDSAAEATVTAGNTSANLRLRGGAPQVASQVTEAQACTIQFRGGGLARAAAVPVEISGEETSGGPVPFVVRLGNLKALQSGGAVTLAGAAHWSVHYSGVPQECDQGGDLMGIPATV